MKTKTLFLIVLISIVVVFSVAAVFADNINIPGDYTTIQAGIDASSDADTVLVQPGTYYENINFNGKNIVLGSLFITTQDTSFISKTVIDGNANGHVVSLKSGEAPDIGAIESDYSSTYVDYITTSITPFQLLQNYPNVQSFNNNYIQPTKSIIRTIKDFQ